MIAKDLVRLVVAAVVGGAVGALALLEGMNRSDGHGSLYVVLGAGIIACVVVLVAAGIRLAWQRGLPAEERAAARAARLEQARRVRPTWADSPGFALLMLGVSGYWVYLLVRALSHGAYGIAVADAVLLLACASAGLRVLRRRLQKEG